MLLPRDLAPIASRAGIRHSCVALDVTDNLGKLEAVGTGEEELEDLGTANDGYWFVGSQRQGLFDRMRDLGAVRCPVTITGEHNVPPTGKHTWQAVERAPPHDHRSAHGQRLEALEV